MTEYKKTYKKSNGTLNPRKYGTKVSNWMEAFSQLQIAQDLGYLTGQV